MTYGDKRNFPRIEIFLNGVYQCTTTWSKTLKEAKQKFTEKYPEEDGQRITCNFIK